MKPPGYLFFRDLSSTMPNLHSFHQLSNSPLEEHTMFYLVLS